MLWSAIVGAVPDTNVFRSMHVRSLICVNALLYRVKNRVCCSMDLCQAQRRLAVVFFTLVRTVFAMGNGVCALVFVVPCSVIEWSLTAVTNWVNPRTVALHLVLIIPHKYLV